MPQALTCALEANDFEGAVRNAIWIGGGSNTISAITGSLAEALFGIPAQIRLRAELYIPSNMWPILVPFFEAARFRAGQFWTCKKSILLFFYKCPKVWGLLKMTGNPDVCYCDKCKENVFFCATPEEYVRFSKRKMCGHQYERCAAKTKRQVDGISGKTTSRSRAYKNQILVEKSRLSREQQLI